MGNKIKTHFAKDIGRRIELRVFWGEDCPDCLGGGDKGYHDAKVVLRDEPGVGINEQVMEKPEDISEEMWPVKCDHCGQAAGEGVKRQVFTSTLFNTPSGKLEPGSIFEITWYDENEFWDNHSGPHFAVKLPNGREWVIDARASNCSRPLDRTHRCWVRHGDPRSGYLHVDKNGDTCNAGAGSIMMGNYHGFLHDGELDEL